MKVRSKKDSTGIKKIKIFESLNFNTNYNFAAPTHKWSSFSFSGQTTVLEKLNINTGLNLEPIRLFSHLVRTPESGPKILGALVFKASMRSFLTL